MLFQADMTERDADTLTLVINDLGFRSRADFMATAIMLFRWAVESKKRGFKVGSIDGDTFKELLMPELERVSRLREEK